MQKGLPLILLVALGWRPAEAQAPQDPFLTLGIQQYSEGDFEAAVFTLDTAVRKLTGQAGRSKELVVAYVHLGAAYVDLDHEDAAKGKFREALALDPALRLHHDRFSPRVIKVFETQLLTTTAARQKKGAKTVLILGGVGAASAIGVAAAIGGGPPANRPPTATVTVSPEGQAIMGITTLTFTASASDPDGDVLSYDWDLGDGTSGSGGSVAHVYRVEGTFRVVLTAADGRGGSIIATRDITARTLNGFWIAGPTAPSEHHCSQSAPTVDCTVVNVVPGNTNPLLVFMVTLADPRRVVGGRVERRLCCPKTCTGGEVSADLNRVTCIESEQGDSVTLIRR